MCVCTAQTDKQQTEKQQVADVDRRIKLWRSKDPMSNTQSEEYKQEGGCQRTQCTVKGVETGVDVCRMCPP
eukprot:1155834-Pelagomonas_calceolata.AAC.4